MLLLSCLAGFTTPAWAQEPAPDDSSSNEEIIVFARKKDENIQDIPLAITAIGGEAMDRRGISSALDLPSITPNLAVNSAFGETQPNYSLRGISVANEFNPNQASPIGVYVDEAYMSNRISHGMQMLDIERVEVLRGPQGTLYGRNTTGGAISVFTRKPGLSGSPNGNFEVGIGSEDRWEARGALDLTLNDSQTWGIRLAGNYVRSNGLIDNLTPGKADLNSIDTLNGRITLRYHPHADFDVTLAGYAGRNRPTSSAVYAIGVLPDGSNPLTGYSRKSLGFFQAEMEKSGFYRTNGEGVLLRVQAGVADDVRLTSITSYDSGGQDLDFDVDGSPFNILFDKWKATFKQFNQELHLNINPIKGVDLVLGGYYGSDTVVIDYRNDFLFDTPFAFQTDVHSKQERISRALFANLDWEIANRLSLSAGIRWTHDSIQVVDDTAHYRGITTIGPNYDTPLRSSKEFSGRFSLDYDLMDDVKVYASYSRGYRGGGYNAVTSNSLASLTYVEPEFVNTYELGFKSRFADRRITFNAAVFYNDYTNQQLQELIGAVSYLRNAGQSTLKGVEAELTVTPVDSLRLSGTLGYLDAKYDKLTLSGLMLDGNRLPFAPEWSGNFNIDWKFATIGSAQVRLNSTVSYTGFQYFSPFNTLANDGKYSQAAYWNLNSQIRADIGNAYVAVWVRNLLNDEHFVYGIDTDALGFSYLVQGAPRTFGIKFGYRFD